MVKNKLKEIRLKNYMMTGREFSKMFNVSNTTYSNWEQGVSRPTLDKALEVAKILNMRIDDVWYLD